MTKGLSRLVMAVALCAPALAGAQRGAGNPNRTRPPQGGPNEQRLMQVIRNQLQLSDAQFASLQETTGKFGPRKRALNDEERDARIAMRDGLCSGDSSRAAEVGKLLDQMIDVQTRRVQLVEEEQRELATYLSPFQRARYLGVQEIVGDVMGGRGGGRGAGARGGRGLGGRPGGPPPGGPPLGAPDGAPPDGMGLRPDICANPPVEGQGGLRGAGRRGRGGGGF